MKKSSGNSLSEIADSLTKTTRGENVRKRRTRVNRSNIYSRPKVGNKESPIRNLSYNPNKKIGVFGWGVHSKRLAEQLGATEDSYYHAGKYDIFIIFYPYPVKKTMTIARMIRKFYKTTFYLWWVGSDVMHLVKKHRTITNTWRNKYLKNVKKMRCKHLCVSTGLKQELKTVGIKADVIALVPNVEDKEIYPLPKNYTVAVYMPSRKTGFYKLKVVKKIARMCPKIKFVLYGNKKAINVGNLKNMKAVGWVDDTKKIFKGSNCYLRLVKHDGFSQSVIEAVAHGRYVITNQNLPKLKTLHNPIDIAKLLNKKPKISQDVIDYYKENYSPDKIRKYFGVI